MLIPQNSVSVINLTSRICSLLGFIFSLLALIVIFLNMCLGMNNLPSGYRFSISFLVFCIAFVLTISNKKWGFSVCLFLLPFLPNLSNQILAYFGYGRILHTGFSGFDLITGFVFGAIVNHYLIRNNNRLLILPWPMGVVMMFITFSTMLAIIRNLTQTFSPFNSHAFFISLINFRIIDWHDDFRPLIDWVTYGCALSALAVSLPIIKSASNKNHLVFRPVILGLLINAIAGLIQNRTGIGLNASQLQFRSEIAAYGRDITGFSAVGFQPDIHAYAGYLMLGAVGLVGYWYYSKSKFEKYLIPALVMPISFLAMLSSKSKSSVALTTLALIFLLIAWSFRKNRYLLKGIYAFIGATCIVLVSLYFLNTEWLYFFTYVAHTLGLSDLEALNYKMAFRPEIFTAAFRMFSDVPLLGLGQGNFYRFSAISEFSKSSFLSTTVNGENAHNYFLQVLVENGLIGFLIISFFVLYPILFSTNKKSLIPAVIALTSIFIGNLYSHSLLIRENFLLATFFISLMYASSTFKIQTQVSINETLKYKFNSITIFIALLSLILGFLSLRELVQVRKKFPFRYDHQCFKSRPLTQDDWTSGIYMQPLSSGVHSVVINIAEAQPAINLNLRLEIVHPTLGALARKDFLLTENGKNSIRVDLPEKQATIDSKSELVLKLDRCYIPRNWGIGNDDRKLGIKIQSITTLP